MQERSTAGDPPLEPVWPVSVHSGLTVPARGPKLFDELDVWSLHALLPYTVQGTTYQVTDVQTRWDAAASHFACA